ncbi:MAG: hypothetical protein ACPGU3_03455 [Litorivicinus sp.]
MRRWFATHPPLEERILRIQPNYDLQTPAPSKTSLRRREAAQASQPQTAESLIQRSVEAASMIHSLPAVVGELAHAVSGVELLIAGLAGQSQNPDLQELAQLSDSQRLAALNLAAPALRRLPVDKLEQLWFAAKQWVQHDGLVEPYEILMIALIEREVNAVQGFTRSLPFKQLTHAAAQWLSYLAAQGARSKSDAEQSFAQAQRLVPSWHLMPDLRVRGETALFALLTLRKAPLRIRSQLIKASRAAIQTDRVMTDKESLLLQAMVEALGGAGG